MWGSPVPANVNEAGALIARSAGAFEPSPSLAAFVADLLREFPSIADDPKRSPWSVTPVPTDRFLKLNFSSYDPEGPSIYLPGADDPVS